MIMLTILMVRMKIPALNIRGDIYG
jgi:hypothetical protein